MDVSLTQAMNAYTNTKKAMSLAELDSPHLPGEGPNSMKPDFVELVSDSMQTATTKGYENEAISAKAIANEAELHELITTVTNAELTLNTVVAVRDRMINAYQDIIKMPI